MYPEEYSPVAKTFANEKILNGHKKGVEHYPLLPT